MHSDEDDASGKPSPETPTSDSGSRARKSIFVAGEVFTYLLALAENKPQDGRLRSIFPRPGGAALLTDLLYHQTAENVEVIGPSSDSSNDVFRSIVKLCPTETAHPNNDGRFRVEEIEYTEAPSTWRFPQSQSAQQSTESTLTIVQEPMNTGNFNTSVKGKEKGREDIKEAKDFLANPKTKLLIYRMARPLAEGLLWKSVRRGAHYRDKLIVIVNADDLRDQGVELSRHISWEKTAEDFIKELECNGEFVSLVNCAHLIVLFGCDGAIHHRRGKVQEHSEQSKSTLYFSGPCGEGDFIRSCPGNAKYSMVGLTTAFVAGLASCMIHSDVELPQNIESAIEKAIKRGLLCARRLAHEGFRRYRNRLRSIDFPLQYIMSGDEPDLQPDCLEIPREHQVFSEVDIPRRRILQKIENIEGCEDLWSILEDNAGEKAQVSHRLVLDGPAKILKDVPFARFSRLMTADRREIEGYRAISNLVEEYSRKPQITRPLCISVFGPPGTGKSFAMKQVAGETFPVLEFNLSQFQEYADLIAAFHLVRDEALSGTTPLVLFDEFDAALHNSKLSWLKYFLAPMQDGEFMDCGRMHPIGRAIFVFIGGTCKTFEDFETSAHSDPTTKGPDFVSRLRGYVNVRGPDPDPDKKKDKTYPIRRALLLHELLKQRNLGNADAVDDALLNALLTVPKYRHGARSLEAILDMSRLSGKKRFERAALPPEDQLNLHVEKLSFIQRMRHPILTWDLPSSYSESSSSGDSSDNELRDLIAIGLHSKYRLEINKLSEGDKAHLVEGLDEACKIWPMLDEQYKESTRRQADDIAYKLLMIKCYSSSKVAGRTSDFEFEGNEVEELAIREHQRSITESLQRQWEYGERRDLAARISPDLVPWRDLYEETQNIYKEIIQALPGILSDLNYDIRRLPAER
ncbi:hypothetical protein BDV36DRAFT_297995 [Aspergillus pseudocaelatus]|uniref:AAA+ ATPase domain-containing protein n=1 Tax=Aspergillus pseudocaelatus TaxID=1825620 RepID=A0ABQ6WIV2_9EURO|nr:hypothetical protein BDV36DRAFT_297995 [Aspergillus pseudocaelatus]